MIHGEIAGYICSEILTYLLSNIESHTTEAVCEFISLLPPKRSYGDQSQIWPHGEMGHGLSNLSIRISLVSSLVAIEIDLL